MQWSNSFQETLHGGYLLFLTCVGMYPATTFRYSWSNTGRNGYCIAMVMGTKKPRFGNPGDIFEVDSINDVQYLQPKRPRSIP